VIKIAVTLNYFLFSASTDCQKSNSCQLIEVTNKGGYCLGLGEATGLYKHNPGLSVTLPSERPVYKKIATNIFSLDYLIAWSPKEDSWAIMQPYKNKDGNLIWTPRACKYNIHTFKVKTQIMTSNPRPRTATKTFSALG
jgi:hypothetical protein